MTRILIVEDEPEIASLLKDYCHHNGFDARISLDQQDIINTATGDGTDMVLLDLMLPGMDGLELCKRIRQQSHVPIMIISARVDEIDRLLGLELGADDYLCKPFSPREVIARIKAILRRMSADTESADAGLVLDPGRLQVGWAQEKLVLTSVEFALIQALAERTGQILSRQQLMDRIYDDHRIVSDRTIDSHIKKLRQKLAGSWPHMRFIESVYGAGYRLDIQPAETD